MKICDAKRRHTLWITFFVFWFSSCSSTQKTHKDLEGEELSKNNGWLSIDEVPLPGIEFDASGRAPATVIDEDPPFLPGKTPPSPSPNPTPHHNGRGQPGTSTFSPLPNTPLQNEDLVHCSPPLMMRSFPVVSGVQNGVRGHYRLNLSQGLINASLPSGSITGDYNADREMVRFALNHARIEDLRIAPDTAYGMAQRFAEGTEINPATARMGAIVTALIAVANAPACIRQVQSLADNAWSSMPEGKAAMQELSSALSFVVADLQNRRAEAEFKTLNATQRNQTQQMRTDVAVAKTQRQGIKRNLREYRAELDARVQNITLCREELVLGGIGGNLDALETELNSCFSRIKVRIVALERRANDPEAIDYAEKELKLINEALGYIQEMRNQADVADSIDPNKGLIQNQEARKLSVKWATYGTLGGFFKQ